jgi:ligand-binding sensor domain-containing protein/serine phosphatase RsbU (regulator of sigma subunit)
LFPASVESFPFAFYFISGTFCTFLTNSKALKRAFVGLLSFIAYSTLLFAGNEVRFRQYTTENGLSQNSVYCFEQDAYGFMWIGTQDGVNRFDGYSFVIYKPVDDDSASVSGTSVRSIVSDSKGNLWLATRTGFCKYDRAANNFIRYPAKGGSDAGPVSDVCTDIEEDKQGNIWISTLDAGVSILNTTTMKFTHIAAPATRTDGMLSGNDVRGLSCGIDGHMWITTWANGTNEYDPATKKFTLFSHENGMFLHPNSRGAVCASSTGIVYIGMWGRGIAAWNPKTKKMSTISVSEDPSDPRGMIWNITEDHKGRIWAATAETGLFMYDPATGETHKYVNNISDPSSINDNNVWSVGVDRTNHIWAGTWQGGVNVLNERISAFAHYRYNPYDSSTLPSKTVWGFCEDGADGLWVGTGSGPAHLNTQTGLIDYRVRQHAGDDTPSDRSNIQCLARDREGKIWMGSTGGGMYVYDPVSDKYGRYLPAESINQLRSSIISALICDRNGDIWCGSGSKVQKFNRETNDFITFSIAEMDSLGVNATVVVLQDHSATELRVGYTTGHVFILDKKTGAARLDWQSPGENITAMLPDKRGGMWYGTGGNGVFYVFNGKATQFTDQNGLPNNSVNAIVFGSNDELWITTNHGVCKLDPLTQEVRTYTNEDGVQGNEFNANAAIKTKDGRIWIGGTNGVTAFYPEEITINQTPADAVITSFTVLNDPYPMKEHVSVAKEIELSWRDYFFSFEYSGMEFTNASKNKYKYMMVGFDEDWVEAGTRRYVTYTNLDPGTYTFRVMASNNDGVWNGKVAEVKVIINPPFWRTTWFYILCIVFVIAAAWIYIRLRERNLRKEKEVLESRVEERTAELKDEKEKVQAAHKDIRDSINYARRIQDSILPSHTELKTLLPDSFVLYIPRDIVSGDFYWVAKPDESRPNEILVAAADCTGHGVPGAFMSMIGNTLLNEAVRQKNEQEPASILNRLHKDIRTALHQDAGSDTRDGMDVAIVRLDFENRKVHYAGANRPLVMVSNGELKEIRADKMPIGGLQGEEERNFTGHTFSVEKGSMIYIFTDGFADQFGGPRGKKFMVRKFYDMLSGMAQQPCIEQHTILMHAIQEWKGGHEQVDDVLVIGIRI